MELPKKKMRTWVKWSLIIGTMGVLAAVGVVWYLFTETFSDTSTLKPDYTVNARQLIAEFQQQDSLANRKYAEKIVLVRGLVTEVEPSDTSVNIKMADTATGAYIIFAFQQQHLAEAKKIKEGDSIAVKGSCSGGTYSHILETEFITFKRSMIVK